MMTTFCAPSPYASFRKTSAFLASSLVLLASLPVSAWEGDGHRHTTRIALASLQSPELRRLYESHASWLANASSHPDRWRNRPDHAEGSRHFLDTERFAKSTPVSGIPDSFAILSKTHPYDKVRSDGYLPWTVERVWQRLVRAFREKRSADVLVQTAYLSHYVADAHVPFHTTENYDGQQSGQRGIHRRFEGTLLEKFVGEADLAFGKPIPARSAAKDMLAVVAEGFAMVSPILDADREASAASGGKFDERYWDLFSRKCRPIAVARLETGGRRLSGLIEAAWRKAGRPQLDSPATMDDRWLPAAPEFTPRGTTPPPRWPTPSNGAIAAARNRTQVLSIPSRTLGRNMPVSVLLPDDYATSGKRYPVLYLLHGASGDHTDWNAKSAVAAYAVSEETIIVMPDALGDSFYLDTPGYGRVATALLDDLLPTIDERYRTIRESRGRAVAGLSMGGYGAWKLALSRRGTFGAAASLSGALGWGEGDGPVPQIARKLYPTQAEALWRKDSLKPLLERHLRRGEYTGPALWFDCGKDDFLLASNRSMDAYLLTKGIPAEYAEFDGGHDWKYWDSHIRDVFQFLRRHLAPAVP